MELVRRIKSKILVWFNGKYSENLQRAVDALYSTKN